MSTQDPTPSRAKLRLDIQALRAFAVSVVVLNHLLGDRVSGGFTGVDVFFVISGFLITSHLIENPPRSLDGILGFWGRRVRRLLPASLTVLIATIVASGIWLPQSMWANTIAQARGAALYVVNFTLQNQAVDYLRGTDPVTPVQHYWSLSVEEQFYFAWPMLILVLSVFTGWVAKHAHADTHRLIYLCGLLALTAASFAWSIHVTEVRPAAAYFDSAARMWELGAGGILAVTLPSLDLRIRGTTFERFRTPVAFIGWFVMAGVVVSYSHATPFPSWRAAVPIAGALLVIAAASESRVFGLGIVQWVGDRSYSIYLWHWPIWILLNVTGHGGHLGQAVTLVATMAMSWATYKYVETPFRTRQYWRPLPRTYALGAALMAVSLAATAVWSAELQKLESKEQYRHIAARKVWGQCFGGGFLDPGLKCSPKEGVSIVPSAAFASGDDFIRGIKEAGFTDCMAKDSPTWTLNHCTMGDTTSSTTIAVVGNSHASQWMPALLEIADTEHYRLVQVQAAGCPFLLYSILPGCARWQRAALAYLKSLRPDLVILANDVGGDQNSGQSQGIGAMLPGIPPSVDLNAVVPLYSRLLTELVAERIPTLVIRDTPSPLHESHVAEPLDPRCLERSGESLSSCRGERSRWEYDDPAITAARELASPLVSVADLNNYICGPSICHAIVGGVVVRNDASHLSATYSRTLAPYLKPFVSERLSTSTEGSSVVESQSGVGKAAGK